MFSVCLQLRGQFPISVKLAEFVKKFSPAYHARELNLLDGLLVINEVFFSFSGTIQVFV